MTDTTTEYDFDDDTDEVGLDDMLAEVRALRDLVRVITDVVVALQARNADLQELIDVLEAEVGEAAA